MATKGTRADRTPAETLPVARVCVDVPLPHLDRLFDYLVASTDDEAAQPGVRVKVRFAGQLVSGFLLERAETSPHGGKLAYLDKVVSPEQVLDPEITRLARAIADRYAGNLCDVLRLAVPPRHARVEAQSPKPAAPLTPAPVDSAALDPAASTPTPLTPSAHASSAHAPAAHPLAAPAPSHAHTAEPADTDPPAGAAPTADDAIHSAIASAAEDFPQPSSAAIVSGSVAVAFDSGIRKMSDHSDLDLGPADGAAGALGAEVAPPAGVPDSTAGGPIQPAVPGDIAAHNASDSADGPAVAADGMAESSPTDMKESSPTGLTEVSPSGMTEAGRTGASTAGVTEGGTTGVSPAGMTAAGTTRVSPADMTQAGTTGISPAGMTAAGTIGASGVGASGVGASGVGASGVGASGVGASGVGASGVGASGVGASGVGASGVGASGSGMAGAIGGRAAGSGVTGAAVEVGGWGSYVAGPAFLRALADGRDARAVWSALPGEDWAARIAEAAAATVRGGRGVVIVVADARDLDRVDRALGVALEAGQHVALNAALGPAERYRRFLAASRHQVPVVVGTRAAMWAPVAKLGLVVIWDDGDDLHGEPRAPYPHAREVLLTRAQLSGSAALVAGFARTGEGQLLLETGWAKEISAGRDVLRRRAPAIQPTGDDPQLARDPGAATARLPSLAWQAARQALQAGTPVLVQVPRRGYLPSIACADCRTPARCPHCSGSLELSGARDVPTCRWCGRAAAAYACPTCGGRRLRASVTGARRTAEELGRAFPGATVRTSGRDEVLDTVPAEPSVVVSTPGAEPVAVGGYGAVLLLDTWALLTRSDLRAAEETMRRWLNAAALAKPAPHGRVIVVADGSLATVQALIRWDPAWFATRELTERRELGFPPAARMASVTGLTEAVNDFLNTARLPAGVELLGPVPAQDDQERMLLRVPRSQAAPLAHALHEAAAVRSAKKAPQPVRIEVDPTALF